MVILCNARELALTLAVSSFLVGCSVYDDALVNPTVAARTGRDAAVPSDAAAAADGSAECHSDCGVTTEADAAADSTRSQCAVPDANAACVSQQDAGCDGASCAPAQRPPEVPNTDDQPSQHDACPKDPKKTSPGICGCGVKDVDSDHDGTLDCLDGCPEDAAKTVTGLCGCGHPDTDTDGDGTADCLDGCPRDPQKTSVGACGCAAVDADRDGDGTADCIDSCADDSKKTSPGACGCGASEAGDAKASDLYCAKALLLHRYSFDGSGATALDSIGGADASIVGGAKATQAAGAVALSGDYGSGYDNEAYVNLPASVWRGLASATFEIWFNWQGAGRVGASAWQRLFDFGTQSNGAAYKYLYVTTESKSGVRVAFSLDGNGTDSGEVSIVTMQPAPQNVLQHVAVVVDQAASSLSLYVDGAPQGSVRLPGTLADVAPVNLWLGRSNFPGDPAFYGSLLEFRIYGTALTSQQVQQSVAVGPNYAFLP
jgi:hypothetical protein